MFKLGTIILLAVILGLFWLINYLTRKYTFTGFSLSRTVDKPRVFPGESFILSLQAVNKKLLPIPLLKIVEKMPQGFEYEISDNVEQFIDYNSHHTSMILMPYQKITRKYVIRCSKRGRYFFSNVNTSAGDFLGLASYSKIFEDPAEVLVYPEIKPLSTLIVNYRDPSGEVSVNRWIIDDPNIVMGIREYTSSDPFNKIHWPSSAKLNQLMVKSYDFTSDQRVMLLLNIETSKPFWIRIDGEKIERLIEIGASVSNELIDAGIATGIFTNASLSGYYNHESNFLNPSCGENQMAEILQLLSRAIYSIQEPFENLLSRILQFPQHGTKYIVITSIITDEMAGLISSIDSISEVAVISIARENLDLLPDRINAFAITQGGIEFEDI